MVERATRKVAGLDAVTITHADAGRPPLRTGAYDVVLCRHVLWAMPDSAATVRTWLELLRPDGRLVLIEGQWANDAGLTATQTLALLEQAGRTGQVRKLDDSIYWGREIDDERYVIVSRDAIADSTPGSHRGGDG